jgi:hypothetical protein
MKRLIKKYFDFIGVKNEGVKRILTIVIVLLSITIISVLYDNVFVGYLFFQDKLTYTLFCYFLILVPPPLIVGVFVKIFTWVKDGFNQK